MSLLVPTRGLEPPHLAAYAPQAYVYTNFTTSANGCCVVARGLEPLTPSM